MKKMYFLLLLTTASLISLSQPLTGTKTIPGDYASFTAAVADLNTLGVGAGGVTFNIAAGYTETAVAAVLTMTPSVPNAARPVVFRKFGAGANPLFTAGVGTGTTDGIVKLNGVDYVTFDGIDLQEDAANVTTTTQMEWGYALVKTSATNGAQNNTIKNCTVTLNKTNINTIGIYIGNHIATSTTGLTLTNFQGTSSYNKFYSNTIQNSFHGIDLNGYTTAPAPFDFYDQGNEIGRDGAGPNTQVLNFGGGAAGTANGITTAAQNNLSVSYTTIDNTVGAATSTTLNGISLGTANNASVDIHHVNVTLSCNGSTAVMTGINNAAGGTGAGNNINIYNCTISNCNYTTATTGDFRAISSTAIASYHNIYNNTISNNTLAGSGTLSAVLIGGGGGSATLMLNVAVHDNTVNANTRTGATGNMRLLNIDITAAAVNVYNNIVTNNSNSTSSGTTYGYFNLSGLGFIENVYDNQIYNLTGGSGETFAINASSGPTGAAAVKRISGNLIHDIIANSPASFVGAIFHDYSLISNTYQNNIYNITNTTTSGATPAVFGVRIGTNNGVQTFIYNNFISELKAPNASNTAAVRGLSLEGSGLSTMYVHHNTIYLNATSTGANFGTTPVFCSSSALSHDLRNNIFVDVSTPAGTGRTIAIQRATATLTNYNLVSGHNCLYAGTPGLNNLIYSDGTNFDQTVQAMKNRVGPREQASFSEIPPFMSLVSPYNLHLQIGGPTQCESGGQPIASVNLDYDGNTRSGSTPDVGADEIAGTTNDIASPDIQYTLLGNAGVAATRAVPSFAVITDPSGVNSTAGTNPRLYYKRSTNANTYVDNTNGTDGWKYVEASNAVSPFAFTIDYSLLFGGGVVAGDVIQYFVTAQDLNATPRIGLNNGGYTLQPANVNLAAANFPLNNTINQYTIVANSYSGIIPVGPAEAITSLTNAGGLFSLINAGAVNGNITISLTGDLTAETGTNALNQWAEYGGSGFTVTVVPSAAVNRTISGSNATGSLIRFDGADRATIDGRFAGVGNYITLRNTSNVTPTIAFSNDAQNNTIRNCIIESGNNTTSGTTAGAVYFGTTTGPLGNDNNTITLNEIRDRSDVAATPAMAINCAGNTTTPAQANSGNIISNNNIHDWFLLNSNSQNAINIVTGNTNFTINGNSFYQTVSRSHTAASGTVTRAISISNATTATTVGGFDITGNFIGGTAPGATGSDWTFSSTGSQVFLGITVTTGLMPSTIRNNVITKINYTSIAVVPAAATMFAGISVTQGNINVAGNTIGATTGTGAITLNFNVGGTLSNFLAGILSAPINGTHNITGNNVGGWTIGGTNVLGAVIPQYIQYQGTPAKDFSISNNTIGSTTTPNSIQNNLAIAASVAFGIRVIISTGPSVTISNNTIQNVTDLSVAATSASYGILLINQVGGTAPFTLTNNIIKDLAASPASAASAINVVGIALQGYAGRAHNFSGNTISNISNPNAGAGLGYTMGIQVQGSSAGGTMSKNKVFDIRNANTGAGAGLAGLYFSAGDGWNVSNNMVSISNGAGVNGPFVYGIADYCNGSFTMNYNSVYVGGTSSGAINTYAFQRGAASRISLKNNLLFNERTGGTGFHYAVGNNTGAPADGWTTASSSYNTFIASSASAVGEWGTGVSQTLAQWRTSSGGDLESYADVPATVSSAALFTNTLTGDLNINIANAESWYVNGKGIAGTASGNISSDYAGTLRGTIVGTPTDIGADEFIPDAGVLPPDAIASALPAPSTTTSYSFGGRKLGEIIWGASVPTSVSWKYYSGIPGPGTTGAVINSYHDVPAVGAGPFNYDMKLYYTLAEQRQIADADLRGIKKDGASPWVAIGGTPSSDAEGKFVTSTGLTTFSFFGLNDVNSPLPVKLISFTGRLNASSTVDLQWQVTEQLGIRLYEVERSIDGRNFTAIGTVTANAANSFTYMLNDARPVVGKNYYRLRVVENDGRYNYSQVIAITLRGKESFVIYPVPATDKITIQTNKKELMNTTAQLVDVEGKTISNIRIVAQVQQVDVSTLPAGIYFLKTADGESYRVVKQ